MGKIRQAQAGESDLINGVVFRSKAYWDYPPDYMEIFRDQLHISEEQLTTDGVFVYVEEDEIVGVTHLVRYNETTMLLDALFVDPQAIGKGCGKCLFMHAVKFSRDAGCKVMTLDADPNVVPFYERMGAVQVGQRASRIPGRYLPIMEYKLQDGE